MNFEGVDIENLRLLNGECLVEIRSMVENEIDFNGGKLKIVTSVKDNIEDFSVNEMISAVNALKKSNYKDQNAKKEYMKMLVSQKREADPNKVDHEAKQAVRRGTIVKLPEKELGYNGWDFDCEFDGVVGDEVWFDSSYSRERLEEKEGGIIIGDKTYLLIPARSIFAAKRGDEIFSLNGYIIGKRLPNDRTYGSLFLPESNVARVSVEVVPTRTPKYKDANFWTNTEVKKGDVICIKDTFAIKLDSTLANTTDLVRFQSRVILAIEE
jgi:hypothetical protein